MISFLGIRSRSRVAVSEDEASDLGVEKGVEVPVKKAIKKKPLKEIEAGGPAEAKTEDEDVENEDADEEDDDDEAAEGE
jgi:hypothetical protein